LTGSPRARGHGLLEPGQAGLVEMGGKPHVPVVETDDEMTPAGQVLAKGLVPVDHLPAEPHDEQQGPAGAVAEGVVLDGDAVGLDACHVLAP
jgi:hypothetical protein